MANPKIKPKTSNPKILLQKSQSREQNISAEEEIDLAKGEGNETVRSYKNQGSKPSKPKS